MTNLRPNPNQFKAIVYIASPYTAGDVQANVDRQRLMAHRLLDLGYCPIVPLLSHYLEEIHPRPWDEWMQMDFTLLKTAHCVLRLPGESKGADLEVAYARELGMPVFYSINGMLEDAYEEHEIERRLRWRLKDTLSLAGMFASSALLVVLALIGVYHIVIGG